MEFGRSSRNHHAHVDSLDELCRNTKFSKKEIQLMYRSFKQECPTGYVEEDTFRQIFSHFFPYGNASLYAHYVFKTFDKNRNGAITFKDFIQCLSLMCRGSIQEKLQWAFKLYDINGDGRITKKELMDIVCSVYALVGRRAGSTIEEKTLRDHVDKIFQKMDINKDGVVTIDEFMEICSKYIIGEYRKLEVTEMSFGKMIHGGKERGRRSWTEDNKSCVLLETESFSD